LIERDAGDLVKTDDVVLTNKAALTVCVVDEHPGHSCFAAGDQVRVRRDLLEEMGFASTARAELDQVVVTNDERNHSQKKQIACTLRQSLDLEADTPE